MPIFRSFRSRLMFYALGLVSLIQLGVFVGIDVVNTRSARTQVGVMLDDGVLGAKRLVESRAGLIAAPLRELAGQAAFRAALDAGDNRTVTGLLQGYGGRAGAELTLLASADGKVVADGSKRPIGNAMLALGQNLIAEARRHGTASGIVGLADEAFLLVVLPLQRAGSAAWLVAGFGIDNGFTDELQKATRLEASIAVRDAGGGRRLTASSLPAMRRVVVNRTLARIKVAATETATVDLFGEEFLTRIVPLGDNVEVVLQRSLTRELDPFDDLRALVLFMSCGGLLLSAFGALFVAREVTEPVLALAEAVRQVERGDYTPQPGLPQQDEIGELATAFTGMVDGLATRDRLRGILGKVVPADVAAKILSKEIELAGEERVVTVLFCDLRRLKAFAAPFFAQYSPRDSIELMNVYLARMTAVIEAHHGVVDRYLGSGIMALFGAPVRHDDDAGNAIAAALAMQRNMEELSDELVRNGLPKLGIGIGIDSGKVIAGNMGGPNRLSYSVIGECVGFAARLEGLSAQGAVEAAILVSAETMRRSRRRFAARPMALSVARGGAEPDLVYAVLGAAEGAAPPAEAAFAPG